ncbi:MAG: DUF1566 domain-containing protein [Candidatus Omnitrophota bacterium]
MKQKQVERILEGHIDIQGMAKALLVEGFNVPAKKKIVTVGSDLFTLMRDSNRLVKLPDEWFRDEFLSMFYGKKFDWAPENLEKHIEWQPAQEHAAKFGRQPSVFELESLKDRTKRNPCIIDAAKILNLKTDDCYWTNEELAGNPGSAWIVFFVLGGVGSYGKGSRSYVRPCRFSQ